MGSYIYQEKEKILKNVKEEKIILIFVFKLFPFILKKILNFRLNMLEGRVSKIESIACQIYTN